MDDLREFYKQQLLAGFEAALAEHLKGTRSEGFQVDLDKLADSLVDVMLDGRQETVNAFRVASLLGISRCVDLMLSDLKERIKPC